MTIQIIVGAIFFGVVAVAWLKWRNHRAEEMELAKYAQMTEPPVHFSFTPNDREVKARADYDRMMLERSGNRFGKGQSPLPVFEYVYCAAEKGGYHSSWNHYLISLGKFVEEHGQKHNGLVMRKNAEVYYEEINGQMI